MNKEQKEIIKRINKAYSNLFILSNITWTPYRDDLFKMNRKEEKQHRSSMGGWEEHHKNSASISDCAKLFTVKHIAESLLSPNKYKVKDLLNIKKSCIYAQSLVDNYKDRIVKAWSEEDFTYLAKLDYVSLVNWNLYQDHKLMRVGKEHN